MSDCVWIKRRNTYTFLMFGVEIFIGNFQGRNSTKRNTMLEMLSFLTQISEGEGEEEQRQSCTTEWLAAKKRMRVGGFCAEEVEKNHVKQNWRQRLVDRCFQYCWRQYVVILNYDWWQNKKARCNRVFLNETNFSTP